VKYRRLGRTALKVSELCLGTMNFGPRTSEQESHSILDAAIEHGINFVDTANQYGGALGIGATEAIIGKWLAANKARRDTLVLATKVHEPMSSDINDRGLSARHIQMACDASLKRLQVDHIDLYQLHHIDRMAAPEEIWQAADRLIAQGKITYVGSSNFPGWKIAQMNEKALASHRLGLVSEQSLYNLIERRAELEVIPVALEYGLGVITWSPLAGGLLAGMQTGDGGRRQSDAIKSEAAARSDQLARFASLCEELGETPAAIALAWTLHQQGIAATIIGPSCREQLTSIAYVPDIQLSLQILTRINDIFPPCGAAPEAYAW
jgi:NDP-hexose C3-ketoreductase / dTDP-4-oxo-2-deoxy-alpha-D-pentos-2-ene 2,3-reductase